MGNPWKRRADGQSKLLDVQRRVLAALPFLSLDDDFPGWPPSPESAVRTRSQHYRAGTRRTKARARR